MRQEYKLKKERWKREMAEGNTPKRQREAVLSQHKDNYKEVDAVENQRLARIQKDHLDEQVRKFRRRRLVIYHSTEQDLLREVKNSPSILRLSLIHLFWTKKKQKSKFSLPTKLKLWPISSIHAQL